MWTCRYLFLRLRVHLRRHVSEVVVTVCLDCFRAQYTPGPTATFLTAMQFLRSARQLRLLWAAHLRRRCVALFCFYCLAFLLHSSISPSGRDAQATSPEAAKGPRACRTVAHSTCWQQWDQGGTLPLDRLCCLGRGGVAGVRGVTVPGHRVCSWHVTWTCCTIPLVCPYPRVAVLGHRRV